MSSYYPLDAEESDDEVGEEEGHRGGIETDSNEESGSYHDDSNSDSDGEEIPLPSMARIHITSPLARTLLTVWLTRMTLMTPHC